MRDWWLNLSLREKQVTALGSIAVIFLLLYALIWAPLSYGVDSLREKISHNANLLSFMRETDNEIQTLERQGNLAHSSNTSLLSTVQSDINNTSFARNITQLQEVENNTVQLKLQKVGFDALMKWLIALCRQHRLVISQMNITLGTDPGIVNAELKLQSLS